MSPSQRSPGSTAGSPRGVTSSPLIPRATPLRMSTAHNTGSPMVKLAKTPLVSACGAGDENACNLDGAIASSVLEMAALDTLQIDADAVVPSTPTTPLKCTPLRV